MKYINPYLNFSGNTFEAFSFYKEVFGGEFSSVMRFKDMPDSENISESVKDKIMHISLPLSNGSILMGSDIIEEFGHKHLTGNNHNIMISTDTKEEADNLFNKLSEGGTIGVPLADQFWGDYFGSFTDKFGINWMIIFEKTN